MSSTMKTVLLVGGTAIATTVAIDLLTGGAVRAVISEKMAGLRSGAADAADAVSEGAANLADGLAG